MRTYRISNASKDAERTHLDTILKVVAESRALLRQTDQQSTFAGRKTQEPFRSEDDDPITRPDMQKLINSELQPPTE
jgi:hypothetical protein